MQNLQTNEALLQNFQVEELEERLENMWELTDSPPGETHAEMIKRTFK